MNDEYCIGECISCKNMTALKNGRCIDCKENDMPDFLKDLFERNPRNE